MNEKNQSKKNYNSEKGITLIALIITVILLLILSLVSLDIVLDGKVFDKARNAIRKANSQTEQVQQQESNATTKWGEIPGKPIKGGTTETLLLGANSIPDVNSITIYACAQKITGEIIQCEYELWIKSENEQEYILANELPNQTNEAILIASDLNEYTIYNWYVTVSDGSNTISTEPQSTRTLCSGTTFICNTFEKCTACERFGKDSLSTVRKDQGLT